jgi:hypothetical protein
MMLRYVLSAVVGLALLTPGEAAIAGERPACPVTIEGSAASLHPEGVAADRGRFLVGSTTHGTVSAVGFGGAVTPLVTDPRLVTTMGVAVDAVRHRVLVANADLGVADRSTPETTFNLGAVGAYDLRTGRPEFYADLTGLVPGPAHFVNDLAVGPDGTVYATDSLAGAVYRIDRRGRASVLVVDPRLAGTPQTGFGLNGIVWAGPGLLVAAHSAGQALVRIPLARPADFSFVTVDAPVGNPDGLARTGAGEIALVDNSAADRIVRVRSRDGFRTGSVVASTPWEGHVPTTLAVLPHCGLYALDGRLDVLLSGGRSDEFTIARR